MNTAGFNHNLGHGKNSIYLFEFPDGKTYVGKTGQEPEKRWNGKYNEAITKAFADAGGRDKVKKSVLRMGLSDKEAYFFEPFYACRHHAYTNGYNIRPSGLSCAILQIDAETFEPIAVWKSAYQAELFLKIPRGNIIEAVKGKKRHSAGGFYWCYANSLCYPEHLRKIIEAKKLKSPAAGRSVIAEERKDAIDKESAD